MILWWWFNGNWYNIITILIPIESKWWAKWWQNVGKYMLYWKCIGTYLEHHLKFIWNYEHHVSPAWNILWLYDEHMMNIVWNLYEHCCDMWQPGQWLQNFHMPDLKDWVEDHWLASSSATMAAMLKVPYPNPDGHFSTWPVLQFLLRISMGMMMRMIL